MTEKNNIVPFLHDDNQVPYIFVERDTRGQHAATSTSTWNDAATPMKNSYYQNISFGFCERDSYGVFRFVQKQGCLKSSRKDSMNGYSQRNLQVKKKHSAVIELLWFHTMEQAEVDADAGAVWTTLFARTISRIAKIM